MSVSVSSITRNETTSSRNIWRGSTEVSHHDLRRDVRRSAPPRANIRNSYNHMAKDLLKEALQMENKEWSGCRLCLHKVMENSVFSVLMGTIIVANAILIIHETDMRASGPGIPHWVEIASIIFLAIYTIEIGLRVYVKRKSFFRKFPDLLDLMVVLTDWCTEFLRFGQELPSVSILRLFRLIRLVRLIAMLSVFHELQTMLIGFASAMKAMFWASLMIGVVITLCSIVAVMLIHPLNVEVAATGVYGDCERCGRAYETVAESNLTFIQQIIAGDSWGKITIPIIEAHPAAGVFFISCFCIIDLGVINLVLMVIVNAAERARAANEDMQFRAKVTQMERMKTRLKELCRQLDGNEDGRISLDEFMTGCEENDELRRTMAGLDIQKQDAEMVYYLMDEDKSGDVDFHEFVHTMMGTKHESWNTKLLFLKASMHQIHHDLIDQAQFIENTNLTISEAVECTMEEASAKMGQQWEHILDKYRKTLAQELDQRLEQLQKDQERICEKLETMAHESTVREDIVSSLVVRPPPCRVPCRSFKERATQAAFLTSTNHIHRQVERKTPEHGPAPAPAPASASAPAPAPAPASAPSPASAPASAPAPAPAPAPAQDDVTESWDIRIPPMYRNPKTQESRTHESCSNGTS